MQYELKPEVSGELGEHTLMDTSVHPPIVHHLHFIFQGWLGDDLLECFPCYMVSEKLKNVLLKNNNLSGFTFFNCEVSISEQFALMHPHVDLPNFLWLKVGKDSENDLFINGSLSLQVSEKALAVLQTVSLNYCDVNII